MFSIKEWQQGKTWRNWSGRYQASPASFYAPHSTEEVCKIVRHHAATGKRLRVTGAAHSFSPVAMPEHAALTLHNMRGLISVDTVHQQATFYAGTYLYEIGPLLAAHGLALENMGDIDAQTLAGVISTGTHGTGITLSSFSNMVEMWGFVNGEGDYIEHHRGDDPLSQALHVSLGLLGILVKVTLRVRPLYHLHYTSDRKDFTTELASFQQTIHAHRHVEWYYFPGSDLIQVKQMDEVPSSNRPLVQRLIVQAKLQVVENGLFYVASEACKWRPAISRAVSKLASKVISKEQKAGVSYEIFPTPRHVRFVETEYAIPLEHFEACMQEIHHTLKQTFDVHFPIECRTSAGEAGFLSPTQGQPTAYIAFHMYHSMNEKPYFEWVHDVMKQFNGRPHWGKMNQYCADSIEESYPQVKQFNEQRLRHDPHNIFMTAYFDKIFKKFSNS